MTPNSESYGRTQDTHATYIVDSCLEKVAGVILLLFIFLLNLLNALLCPGIGCDTISCWWLGTIFKLAKVN